MRKIGVFLLIASVSKSFGTTNAKLFFKDRFSMHAQATVVYQYKLKFAAPYSGKNSLITNTENKLSVTSTLYAGAKLWKGASIFVNPEVAGGGGLSNVLGIAAATNGETFRIGDPSPKLYLARLFFRQVIPLSKTSHRQESDFNLLAQSIPDRYLALTIGKISIADYFDNNTYSHDPRSQFLCWGLMSNGAWDYPANTRGYTPSIVLEYVSPKHEIRYGVSLTPKLANGNEMDYNLRKAYSHTLEYTFNYKLNKHDGSIKALAFFTHAFMGNYNQSIALQNQQPEIEATRNYRNYKFGFGINIAQDITDDLGTFVRASWNDGQNETWTFTEIDRGLSAGLVMKGNRWNRDYDRIGLGYVVSFLSKPHIHYLEDGGKGFILGDGKLNYSPEHLLELHYKASLFKENIFLTGAYQFLANPGYNKDRKGPVNIFSVRLHFRI